MRTASLTLVLVASMALLLSGAAASLEIAKVRQDAAATTAHPSVPTASAPVSSSHHTPGGTGVGGGTSPFTTTSHSYHPRTVTHTRAS